MKSQSALIIGAGEIAKEYAKILKESGVQITMVCRSQEKADAVMKLNDYQVHSGGCTEFLKNTKQNFDMAINAVTAESLFEVNKQLVKSKRVKKVLCEKPGALRKNEFDELSSLSLENNIHIYIAYNRRYFSSTIKLKEILATEQATSAFFEFTEWFWKINIANYSKEVIEEWLLANSSHVIDLAFHLGGGVSTLSSLTRATDPKATIQDQYVGHGRFNSGAVFSYIADWKSAGRWKVEFSTIEGRYMLCPLEKLFFQKRGMLEYSEIAIENSLDLKYKPGFYLQVQDFLLEKPVGLKSMIEQKSDCVFFDQVKKSY